MSPHFSNIKGFYKPGGGVSRFRYSLTPVFVLALLLWLLNPYACCPADTASAMPMTNYTAAAQQPAVAGNGVDFAQRGDTSQSTVDSLHKGTPRSLSEPTPNLPSPVLAMPVRTELVTAVLNPDENLLSEIILPSVPPPRC